MNITEAGLINPMTVSVIVPVYNEARTVETLLRRLIYKRVVGVEFQIIVVHGPSTDGTGYIVDRLADRHRLRVIHQCRSLGKGHAVRLGLEKATGDVIMIQDADLEYSVEDYNRLLEPFLTSDVKVVLGSRHSENGAIRSFTDNPLAASVMNLGHRIFAFALSVLFGSKLKDPFTMFKLFRRECVAGASFKCNRFDFDFELIITLLKRGYQPLEIPVRYHSRSFLEGKKVRLFSDPLSWMWTMARLWLNP